MSKPFDATVKEIARIEPAAFLAALTATPAALPVDLINVDLSTMTRQADLVFAVGQPWRYLAQVEVQASADARKPSIMLLYNALLSHRYSLPVQSTLVLLRPEAEHSGYSGSLVRAPEHGLGRVSFEYAVARLWHEPAEVLLGHGLSLSPLAVLGALPLGTPKEAALQDVVHRPAQRLQEECDHATATKLLTAAYILAGLRLEPATATELFARCFAMRESSTYQAVLEEGRTEGLNLGRQEGQNIGRLQEARRLLLELGALKFGEPSPAQRRAIDQEPDIETLHRLAMGVIQHGSWSDLMDQHNKN